ncbi:ABC transporter permease [Mesorhizobium marinum]|uniref:ABC transporter permease n=1 Tax=Mesorhizobium marinum TaxID=3228790 RepID=A0ABV3QZL6_9HYPH
MTRLLILARRFGPYRAFADMLSTHPRLRYALVAVVPLLWIVVADIAPLVRMVLISFYERFPLPPGETPSFTLAQYQAFVDRPLYLSAFVRTFVFGGLATLLTLVVIFPIAYYISKVVPRDKRLRLLLLAIAPFWISEVIRSFAWILMLANKGAINSFLIWTGLIGRPIELLYNNISLTIGVLYLTSLYMLLPLYAALEKIDDRLIEAASDLGASRFAILRRIIMPLSREGIITGCVLVFLLVTGLYALPQLLGGPSNTLFASIIGQVFSRAGDSWPLGSAFSVILIGTSLVIVAIFMALFQSRRSRA